MKLPLPKEPKDVLAFMKTIPGGRDLNGVDWDPMVVWYGNQLPQYLWHEWKPELISRGFTWQKFLKLLRLRTDTILGWYKGWSKWEDTAKSIIVLIESPVGQDIANR